jgi:hypothetical protein
MDVLGNSDEAAASVSVPGLSLSLSFFLCTNMSLGAKKQAAAAASVWL